MIKLENQPEHINSTPEAIEDPYLYHRERYAHRMLFKFVRLFIFLFLIGASFWFGYSKGRSNGQLTQTENIPLTEAKIINNRGKEEKQAVDFSLFWKTWDLLKEKYVDAQKLNSQDLVYGAIKGMLKATGDPYTTFFDPEENKQFDEDITGKFEGIGAEIGMRQDIITIVAPLEGAPAEKAGLRAGDKILKINDDNAADMTLEQAVDKMRGPKGTEVRLTIFRNGGEETTQEITITRDTINVKSVKIEFKDDGIGVIKVSRFGEDTTREFGLAVLDVATKASRGLVIDLRNNPGGYLDASVDMASKLMPANKVVVIEEDSKGGQKKLYTEGGDLLSGVETVVLINEGSASASEILAGALRDNRENITIMGKKSFGKGSVQELMKLPQGTAVKITIAKWLTPSGQQINNEGITPKIEVDISREDIENDRDPQMDKALELLKGKVQ